MDEGYIAVDLDGTLAYYDLDRNIGDIGSPIPVMFNKVKNWLGQGITVKIFTARASDPKLIPPIEKWLEKHGIGGLEITNKKDFNMLCLYDDRAIGVIHNEGITCCEEIEAYFGLN